MKQVLWIIVAGVLAGIIVPRVFFGEPGPNNSEYLRLENIYSNIRLYHSGKGKPPPDIESALYKLPENLKELTLSDPNDKSQPIKLNYFPEAYGNPNKVILEYLGAPTDPSIPVKLMGDGERIK